MSKLIFGCGYLGGRVARRWRQAGHEVFVVTRTGERARALSAEGYRPIVADVLQPATLADLAGGRHRAVRGRLRPRLPARRCTRCTSPACKRCWPHCRRRPASSSTSARPASTAKRTARRVDEDSPCEPTREGGRACLAAEQPYWPRIRWAAERSCCAWPACMVRGEFPMLAEIRRGQPIAVPAAGYLNLIHVDDAAAVVLAADERASPPRTYPGLRRPAGRAARVLRRAGAAAGRRAAANSSPPPADAPAAVRATADKRIKQRSDDGRTGRSAGTIPRIAKVWRPSWPPKRYNVRWRLSAKDAHSGVLVRSWTTI